MTEAQIDQLTYALCLSAATAIVLDSTKRLRERDDIWNQKDTEEVVRQSLRDVVVGGAKWPPRALERSKDMGPEYYRELRRENGRAIRRAEGERMRSAEEKRNGWIGCDTCRGTGRSSDPREPSCRVCDGTGNVPPNFYTRGMPMITCPSCEGIGYTMDPYGSQRCMRCAGSGKIQRSSRQ